MNALKAMKSMKPMFAWESNEKFKFFCWHVNDRFKRFQPHTSGETIWWGFLQRKISIIIAQLRENRCRLNSKDKTIRLIRFIILCHCVDSKRYESRKKIKNFFANWGQKSAIFISGISFGVLAFWICSIIKWKSHKNNSSPGQ